MRQTRQVSTSMISRKNNMADLSEHYAAHIGRVQVDFYLLARNLDPDAISQITGLKPDRTARLGDERRNYKGEVVSPHDEGLWMIGSKGRIESKDINDHINSLLAMLLPHKATFLQIITDMEGETFFDVLWTSNYLYAGSGPVISREALQGMSDLGASIGFDIYADE